jgi:putative ABC transport system permease protein
MGIRLALGAEPAALGRLVLRQGAVLVGAGVACGVLLAAGVARAMSRLLFLDDSLELATFAAVTALLSAIALLACYLPARRATRVNPVIALRHE